MTGPLNSLYPPPSILEIPPEIIIQIFAFCHHRDLVSLQLVCHAFHELIQTSLDLRYVIELGADDLIDNPHYPSLPSSAPLSTADCLNLLLDRRARWRTLDWTQSVTVPLRGPCQAYELVGGVFAKSMRSGLDEETWPPGSRHLIGVWLPNRNDKVTDSSKDLKRVVKENLGVPTRDFAIDPTQDVLALVEVHVSSKIMVHVLTLSTQTVHPKAAKSSLISPAPSTDVLQELPVGSCFVQIVGDVVGMFFWHNGSSLRIWNWHTGDLVVSQNDLDLPAGTWDFAFLSPRAYMLAKIGRDGSLDLFSFDGTKPVDDEEQPPQPPTHVLTLLFPALLPGRQLRSITSHSAPHLGDPSAQATPFYKIQEHRIHLLQLHYGDSITQFNLFVKNEYLLDLIDEIHNQGGVYAESQIMTPAVEISFAFIADMGIKNSRGRRCLHWEQWGPNHTRMHQQNVHFQWLRYVSGHRVVLPPLSDTFPVLIGQHQQREQELRVFDFNVHPKRLNDPCDDMVETRKQKDLAEGETLEWHYELKADPTVIPAQDVFVADITTSLPYSVTTRRGAWRYTGFMIDEERLIGMKDTVFYNACDLEVFTL